MLSTVRPIGSISAITVTVEGRRGAVRGRVHGVGRGPVFHAAVRRRVLLPGQARAPGAADADRGGARAAGQVRRTAADQPVPGRAVGRVGRARGGRPPGRVVAAAGGGVAVGRRRRRGRLGRCARHIGRTSAAVPARRLPVARLLVEVPARRHPRRRHGAGEDVADAGPDLPCAGRPSPTGPPFLIVAPTSVVSNWAAEAARFAPGLDVVPITDTLRRRGQTLPRGYRERRRRGHVVHPVPAGLSTRTRSCPGRG